MKRAKQHKQADVPAVDPIDNLDDRLLTTDAAARFLGYHAATLRKFRVANLGPPYIVLPNGFSIRYQLGALRSWAGLKKGSSA